MLMRFLEQNVKVTKRRKMLCHT